MNNKMISEFSMKKIRLLIAKYLLKSDKIARDDFEELTGFNVNEMMKHEFIAEIRKLDDSQKVALYRIFADDELFDFYK